MQSPVFFYAPTRARLESMIIKTLSGNHRNKLTARNGPDLEGCVGVRAVVDQFAEFVLDDGAKQLLDDVSNHFICWPRSNVTHNTITSYRLINVAWGGGGHRISVAGKESRNDLLPRCNLVEFDPGVSRRSRAWNKVQLLASPLFMLSRPQCA